MTLERAVAMLNFHGHRGAYAGRGWQVSGSGPDALVFGPDRYDGLDPFETIAIAEAYEKADRETAGAHLRRPLD